MKDSARHEFKHTDWSKNASIYEVNIGQFTPEGTIKAFKEHLPRIMAMGVNILWLMPIHPIGVRNRKGSLGSCYSVQDYFAVNPSLGTLDEFKSLVGEIHALGMYVILDWVANHTAWDNTWVTEHPDWYKKNEQGEIHACIYDNGKELEFWDDVVGLDYRQPAVWNGMIEALRFWIETTDIDGYRCDVAGLVPTPFWERARKELEAIKPVFMLAEWSSPELHHRAFDMTYDWTLHDVMSGIAKGKLDALALREYVENPVVMFPEDAYRMVFTTNHDKNSWESSDTELYGDKFPAFAVLAATLTGMPLIYGGQESVLDKRISFFEKDPIDWKQYKFAEFYKKLLQLKRENPALWNGQYGAKPVVLKNTNQDVFAFRRQKNENEVTVFINFSDERQAINKSDDFQEMHLEPWGYRIIATKCINSHN